LKKFTQKLKRKHRPYGKTAHETEASLNGDTKIDLRDVFEVGL
jgi:hypothetical protein